jgi:hypothetical protein
VACFALHGRAMLKKRNNEQQLFWISCQEAFGIVESPRCVVLMWMSVVFRVAVASLRFSVLF